MSEIELKVRQTNYFIYKSVLLLYFEHLHYFFEKLQKNIKQLIISSL